MKIAPLHWGSLTYRFYPQETSILHLGVGGGGLLAAVTFSVTRRGKIR